MSLHNEFFKKPGRQEEYAPDQITEMAKCMVDPVYFIQKYVKIQHPSKGKVPFKMFDYQIRMVEGFLADRFCITKVGRQMGKTTVIAAYLLWFATFKPDKVVLVASNKNSNAMEIMARITFAYEELPMWLKAGVKYGTKHSLEFDNGSKIISSATTENTGRGLSISLLMLDELAFVKRSIQYEMWTALAPTLSTGGSCIISSTPNGDNELFADLWHGAELDTNGFRAIPVEWDEHPDRDASFKEDMIGKVGELMWKQEYECQMISSDALLISAIALQNMKGNDPLQTNMGFRFYTNQISSNKTYYVGCDVGTGSGGDYSTIQVFEFPTLVQVAEWRSNTHSIPRFYAHIKWILSYLQGEYIGQSPPEVYWSYESNGVGAGIEALYRNDEKFPEAYLLSDQKRPGIATTGKNKILTCMELKNMVEKKAGGFNLMSKLLIAELKNFVSKGASYEARAGATDDLVSAMLIIVQMIRKASEFDQEAFDIMYQYHEADEVDDGFGSDPMPMAF